MDISDDLEADVVPGELVKTYLYAHGDECRDLDTQQNNWTLISESDGTDDYAFYEESGRMKRKIDASGRVAECGVEKECT